MTSRRPCWCPKPVLWELNSFLMQTLSSVPNICIDASHVRENTLYWGDLPRINVAISKGLLASLIYHLVVCDFFLFPVINWYCLQSFFVFVWKIGVHLTIVRLGPLSTNVDLVIVDDKYRIISSLLGSLLKNNDRARSTRLSVLRRPRREGISRFNRHLSVVLKPACHYFGHWGRTEGNDLSDLLFHSLKIIPCSKRWKGTLTGVELLFLPESPLYDVWRILD